MISQTRSRHRPCFLGAVLTFGLLCCHLAEASSNAAIDVTVRAWAGAGPLPTFTYALVDLNDDGIPDALVLMNGSRYCGSGGCDLVILMGTSAGFKVVSSSTITREPISVLPAKRHHWHTLAVNIAGGGVSPAVALLRYDGHRYPKNPSIQPIASSGDLIGATILNMVP